MIHCGNIGLCGSLTLLSRPFIPVKGFVILGLTAATLAGIIHLCSIHLCVKMAFFSCPTKTCQSYIMYIGSHSVCLYTFNIGHLDVLLIFCTLFGVGLCRLRLDHRLTLFSCFLFGQFGRLRRFFCRFLLLLQFANTGAQCLHLAILFSHALFKSTLNLCSFCLPGLIGQQKGNNDHAGKNHLKKGKQKSRIAFIAADPIGYKSCSAIQKQRK